MITFKKTLVAIAAAATLGATALASTEASAWCGDSGYSSYDYNPSYNYNSYYYNSDHHDRGDRGDFRGHDRGNFRRH